MKTKIRHLSNYLISVEPDLLLAQPNPRRTYECPNIDECLGVVPRPPGANDEYNICLKLVVLVSNTCLCAALLYVPYCAISPTGLNPALAA